MLTVFITLLVSIAPGLAAWMLVHRWPQLDPMEPEIDVEHVKSDARRHPRLVAFVRSRFDPEATTGLILSAAIVVVVGGAVGVGILLVMIHTDTGFARLDRSASLFGAHHATALSTRILKFYTQLGGALVLVPLAVIVGIVESRRQRSVAVIAFLTFTVGGQFLVANVTKWLVGRARPNFDRLTGFSGPSFPSGHAVASAACLAAFALVIGRRRSRRVRAVLAGVAVGVATGIACTRVMLGVHWLTDVLAGLAMGWAWFALCSIAFGGRQLRFGAPAEAVQQAASVPG